MEDTNTVIELTEFVSPLDPKIRHVIEKKRKYLGPLLHDKRMDELGILDFQQKYHSSARFRKIYCRFFIYGQLLKMEPGEKLSIVKIFDDIQALVEGDADWDTYIGVCPSVYSLTIGKNILVNEPATA